MNNNTTTYAHLLKLAEAATSRKEARHLINEATRLFEGCSHSGGTDRANHSFGGCASRSFR